MLQEAANDPGAPDLLKEIVKQRSSMGFTIIIGTYRHYKGRTYGGKAKGVTEGFIRNALLLFKDKLTPVQKVRRLESLLKIEAKADAEAMEAVVGVKDINAEQWKDIKEQDLTKEEKETLRDDVAAQVVSGERLIKSSNIVLNVPMKE